MDKTFNIISLDEYTKETKHIKIFSGPHTPIPDSGISTF